MDATRATEQSQDSRSHYTKLDNRYGKIGISAVAAAIRHQSARRAPARDPPDPLRQRLTRPPAATPARAFRTHLATLDARGPR